MLQALPAGFEGQNSRFATTLQDVQGGVTKQSVDYGDGDSPWSGFERGWWWWRPWWSFSHTEMRDDRMLLFSNHLPAGVYTYSYTARATTIGEFQLPPVHAEAMYQPEVYGRSTGTLVEVREALERCGGVQGKAWRELGLANRYVLKRLMQKYGLR